MPAKRARCRFIGPSAVWVHGESRGFQNNPSRSSVKGPTRPDYLNEETEHTTCAGSSGGVRDYEAGDLVALACLEKVIAEEEAHRDSNLNAGARPWPYAWIHGLATHATRGVIALGLRED
jgi:hypothetical protein